MSETAAETLASSGAPSAPPATSGTATVTSTVPATNGNGESSEGSSSWLEGMSSEDLTYVQGKGWGEQGPKAVVQAYRNFEKLRGAPAERILTLPEDPTAEGSMDAVWDRLGRPESPDKYEVPDLDEEGSDFKLMPVVKEFAHKAGISQQQLATLMEGIEEAVNDGLERMTQGQRAEQHAMLEREVSALKHEWGPSFDEGNEAATQGMAAVSTFLPEEKDIKGLRDYMGYKPLMSLLRWIGEGNAESQGSGSEMVTPSSFKNSPDWAKEQIATEYKPGQPLFEAHAKGEKWAADKVKVLHEIASKDPNWRPGSR